MSDIHDSDVVRLVRDVPTLGLYRGEVGVVQSRWHAPVPVYEVEFRPRSCAVAVRTLLFRGFLEFTDRPVDRASRALREAQDVPEAE